MPFQCEYVSARCCSVLSGPEDAAAAAALATQEDFEYVHRIQHTETPHVAATYAHFAFRKSQAAPLMHGRPLNIEESDSDNIKW